MIRGRSWIAGAMVFALTPAAAQDTGDGLGKRIAAGLHAIWPDERFEVTFAGCEMTRRQITDGPPQVDSIAQWWLGDFETDPDLVFQDHQRISDGERIRVSTSILLPLRPEIRDREAANIAAFIAALEALPVQGDRSGILGWLWGREEDSDAMMRQLYAAREAGEFGAFLTRNIGHAAVAGADGARKFEIAGFFDGGPGFVFNDDVRDEILRDLHNYAMQHCP